MTDKKKKKKKKQIREWRATPDPTGLKKGTYELSPLRSLNLSKSYQEILPSKTSCFGVFVPLDDKEIYIFFKNMVMVLEITSPLEDKEGEGRIALGSLWDFFEGEGEGGEGGEREEVWCGVYFGLRKEVWVGTSTGWVWRKGEKLERRKIEGGVRAMAVVGNQVSFILFHFFLVF